MIGKSSKKLYLNSGRDINTHSSIHMQIPSADNECASIGQWLLTNKKNLYSYVLITCVFIRYSQSCIITFYFFIIYQSS